MLRNMFKKVITDNPQNRYICYCLIILMPCLVVLSQCVATKRSAQAGPEWQYIENKKGYFVEFPESKQQFLWVENLSDCNTFYLKLNAKKASQRDQYILPRTSVNISLSELHEGVAFFGERDLWLRVKVTDDTSRVDMLGDK